MPSMLSSAPQLMSAVAHSVCLPLSPSPEGLVKEATFNGLLGLQNAQASNTISCSPHIYGGCKDNIGMDTTRAGDPPTYAELQFSC